MTQLTLCYPRVGYGFLPGQSACRIQLSLVLLLPLLSTALPRQSAYVGPHVLGRPAISPMALKEADVVPLEDYERQYTTVHKYKKNYYHNNRKYYPPHEVLKAEISDELPVLPKEFANDMGPDPRGKDLRAKTLKKKLGGGFDKRFQSQETPLDSVLKPNGTLVYRFKRGKPAGRMPRELRKLQFTIPERRSAIRLKNKKMRRKMQEFLWAYSYCPVLFKWRHLGPKFWPRWIKEGSCYSERSCSFPAGMTCRPRGQVAKKLLFWHCSTPNYCKWIVIQYPIVTECQCGC